jgi:hypothetical protein
MEPLESRELFSASMATVSPPSDSGGTADQQSFTSETETQEAKESFTRRKPQVPASVG